MPVILVPHRSGVHRTAVIALFRSLLQQSNKVPVPDEQRAALQNVVRNRFKQSRHVVSTRRLTLNLDAGYEAVDLLDSASAGSEEGKTRILALLERAPLKLKQPPRLLESANSSKLPMTIAGESTGSPKKHAFLNRPIPKEQLTGQRRIPVLFSANKIPVLRFKKPQPPALSGYLNHRIQQRQKLYNQRLDLEDDLALADYEDAWDEIVAEYFPGGDEQLERESAWDEAVLHAMNHVQDAINKDKWKNRDWALKMQAVVDREIKLREEERAEQREQKPLVNAESRKQTQSMDYDDNAGSIEGTQPRGRLAA